MWRYYWPDCKPEGSLFLAEFVCLCVCVSVSLCVSDRHFYSSTLTGFDETWSQGPYSEFKILVHQFLRLCLMCIVTRSPTIAEGPRDVGVPVEIW